MSSFSPFLSSLQFATVCATAAFVVLLNFRVNTLEAIVPRLAQPGQDEDEAEEQQQLKWKQTALELEKKVVGLEAEMQELKKQQLWLVHQHHQMVQQMQQHQHGSGNHSDTDRRSDTDYVNVFGSVTPHPPPPQYEIANWTSDQSVKWVEKVLGNNSASAIFENIDGPALLDMLLDGEHGFSFGDKCFFMGVDRDSSTLLERACGELLRF